MPNDPKWFKTLCPDCGPLYLTLDANPNQQACGTVRPIEACERPSPEEWDAARAAAVASGHCNADHLLESYAVA